MHSRWRKEKWTWLMFRLANKLNKLSLRLARLAKACKLQAYGIKNCGYCGRVMTVDNFTLDHIVPKHVGGRDTASNLRVCCITCNKYKGPFHIETFRNRGIGRGGKFYFESQKPVLIDYSNCYVSNYKRAQMTKEERFKNLLINL